MSLNEKETKGIRAVMIIEVLGKPPEHLKETLNEIINQIDKEKGVSIKEKRISEPKKLEDSKKIPENFDKKKMTNIEGFYTNFAEIEVEVEEIFHLVILMFKYMPAHIDIIYPELIALTNNGWNEILNELTRRLHGYDEIARVIQVEKAILENKLKESIEKKEKKK